MSQNPLVLSLHFLLELFALAAVVYWGWSTHQGVERWAWAIVLPVVAAVAWTIFRAAGDGPAPIVEIPGIVRLALELVVLGGAAALLWSSGQAPLPLAFALLILLDFGLSYDRVGRLVGLS